MQAPVSFNGKIGTIVVLLSVFFALIAPQTLATGPPEVEWKRTYGVGQAYCVQETSEGGYIIIADSKLIKTDPQGNLLWRKDYGGRFVQQTSDGGYIIAGDRNGMVLTKLDASGTKEWEQVFQEDGEGGGHCVQQTRDGGYIIGGTGGSGLPGSTSSFLIKTDGNGNEEWRQVYGYSYTSRSYESVQQTADGGYITGGTVCHPYPCDALLTKTGVNGNAIWERAFRSTGTSSTTGSCAQPTSDGGYILVGTTESANGDIYLVKTDDNGNKQWDKTIGGEGSEAGYSVQQTVDGGYIIAGYTYAAGNADVYVIKTDAQGNVLWEKTIDRDFSEAGRSIQQTADGGYIIAGYTSSWDDGNWYYDIYLIKLKPENAPTTRPPIADAGPDQTVTDTDGDGQEQVTLDGSGSYDPDGHIVSWVWTENGSQIATGEMPVVTLPVGTHTITLIVTDNDTATDTDEVAITVQQRENQPPIAAFTYSPQSPVAGEKITFDASDSYDPDGYVEEYAWSFYYSDSTEGYCEPGSGEITDFSYPSAGNYAVSLVVFDNNQAYDSITRIIAVGPTGPVNHPPITHALSDISGQPQTMLPDTVYSVTAKYFDPDGREDLKICYLRLNHPTKPLTMMWYQVDGHTSTYAGEEGENYLTIINVTSSEITDADDNEGYELTWNFKINNKWPEVENAIDFGVFAQDDGALESGWDYDDRNASFITAPTKADWTVLIYMDGDNEWEKFAIDDFLEISSVGSSPDVNLVVQMDRIDKADLPSNTYDDTRYENWTICHRFKVAKNMEPTEANAITDWGDGSRGHEVNMGDPATLTNFIEWAKNNYPAEHYLLILHAPGLGFRGVGCDRSSKKDRLELAELKEALRDAGVKFDIIGFDACLMGLSEVAYEIRDYADYIVASQGRIHAPAWPYDTILADLVKTPTISGQTLAKAIVSKYGEYYGPGGTDPIESATMAAVDTSRLEPLAQAIDDFAKDLNHILITYRAEIKQAREEVEWYALSKNLQSYYYNIYIDISHFAELIKQNVPDQSVKDSADSVIDALSDAVVSEWHYHPNGAHPNSHGLSIYFTKQDCAERCYDTVYDSLDFSIQTHWNEFLHAYLGSCHYGYAIIVAGQGGRSWKGRRLNQAFDHCANNAYRVLRNLGFDDDHICYLNSRAPQDVDGDGDDEVDAPALLSYFEKAVNEARVKIGDNTSIPFILYLVGHGLDDTTECFVFDEDAGEEGYLWSEKLQDMLDKFPSEVPMLIVIGSCYSGSFITSTTKGPASISGKNRIIITAAHDDQERFSILGFGGWFHSSDRFWGNLNKGLNVKDAFVTGAWPGEWWHLWLDDNGDRKGSPPNNLGKDGVFASRVQIGVPNTEHLKLTSWYLVWKHSPGELRVYDSQNRVTGLVNGEIKEEIPNSIYDEENDVVMIFSPSGSYRYEVVGKNNGTYGLDIASIENGEATTFTATDIPITQKAVHEYTINWDALARGEKGVTVQIDKDGDGVFERTIRSGTTLNGVDVGVIPTGEVVSHGPNPVPAEGCVFWLNLPDDAVEATLKIFDIDGAELVNIPLDPTADRYPAAGRWIPEDHQGRLLGTGLYLYLVEIKHADGTVPYSPVQKMVIER